LTSKEVSNLPKNTAGKYAAVNQGAGRSLVHLLAKRAGLQAGDIDCCTIPLTLPYVKLTKNI
jgi:hypothetical protein